MKCNFKFVFKCDKTIYCAIKANGVKHCDEDDCVLMKILKHTIEKGVIK